MSGQDEKTNDSDTDFGAVDFVLGQGSESERSEFESRLGEDLSLALDVADCTDLLERFRGLSCEPTGRVPRRLWSAVRRRAELRSRPRRFGLLDVVTVVGIAAVCLLGLVTLESLRAPAVDDRFVDVELAGFEPIRPAAEPDGDRPLAGPVIWPHQLPVASAGFRAGFERLSQLQVPTTFGLSMDARELLARARHEAELRMEAGSFDRHRGLGLPDLGSRTRRLAADLAERLDLVLETRTSATSSARQQSELVEIAWSTRALIASGSTPDSGPHRSIVERAGNRLVEAADRLSVRDRIAVGSALIDLAVVSDGPFADAARQVAETLVDECEAAAENGGLVRPALLAWRVPHSDLGEAGRLLQLAPAFGADSAGCFVTRLWILAHLFERDAQWQDSERPELLTAQLYGFGDLIERSPVDHRLRLWTTGALFLRQPAAAQQLAWSRYPIRRGWTEFQQELPSLAIRHTPQDNQEAAALLMTLCTNVAAPGVSSQLALQTGDVRDPIATLFFQP